MFRKRKLTRFIAVFLLVNAFYFTFLPTISQAITGGSHQPEFVSYQSPGSSDLVNLITGDFTYSLPVMSIPVNGSSFNIPLFYNGGIALEQEASWVGLGWNINIGSITRNVSGHPDDAKGELRGTVTMGEDNGHTLAPRWESFGWDTEKGGITEVIDVTGQYYTVQQKQYPKGASSDQEMYGALYLGDIPTTGTSGTFHPSIHDGNFSAAGFNPNAYARSNNVGGVFSREATSDARTDFDNYNNTGQRKHSSISYDNYIVNGVGISGNIKPYRLETGSIAYPQEMIDAHYKYDVVPFKNDYKVGFRYTGNISNNYEHHLNPNLPQTSVPGKQGIDHQLDANRIEIALEDQRLYESSQRIEAAREGLDNNTLLHGRDIKWFTNSEIADNSFINEKFMDFTATGRTAFRTQSWVPSHGIGGFMITGPDGMTYHYALPVYNKQELSFRGGDNGDYTRVYNNNAYATTWLLTAITGPDFVDKGTVGIVDQQDLGYWLSFDYGKFSDKYKWRIPYGADGYSEISVDHRTFDEGIKETYYLDKITSRSHTAIFVKSLRKDGRGHYTLNSDYNLATSITQASSSLKLDYIALMTNEDYASLAGSGFAENVGPATTGLTNGDTFNNVIDAGDVSSYSTFIRDHSIRSVFFDYANDVNSLTNGTLNSFDDATSPATGPRRGKLTLTGVRPTGKKEVQLIPGYKFEYDFNPDYHEDHWDSWGMYKSDGDRSIDAHETEFLSEEVTDATAWSLTKIIAPTGSETIIDYQNDIYTNVSGNVPSAAVYFGFNSNKINSTENSVNISNVYNPTSSWPDLNEDVTVSFTYYDDGCSVFNEPLSGNDSHSVTGTVASKTASQITINYNSNPDLPTAAELNCGGMVGTISWINGSSKRGGDVRVSSITLDNLKGERYVTSYQYGEGVAGREPAFSGAPYYGFYDRSDHPGSPVYYSSVSVLSGRVETPDGSTLRSAHTTQTYEFHTPHINRVLINESQEETDHGTFSYQGITTAKRKVVATDYNVNISTSLIGSLKSVTTLQNGVEVNKVTYNYSDDVGQGRYTEGSIMAELLWDADAEEATYLINRTSKTYKPWVLTNVTTTGRTTEDQTIKVDYIDRDFYTGAVLTSESESAVGYKTRSVTVPAYKAYPSLPLAHKTNNSGNYHMLTPQAATYTYLLDENDNISGLVSAGAQTWKNNWLYRTYDLPSGNFILNNDNNSTPRPSESYVYRGNLSDKRIDGTLTFNPTTQSFDFSSGSNSGWLKTSEITLYDQYSNLLEARDLSDIHTSNVMGYENNLSIAAAGNARYVEIAYSGAEEPEDGNNYFGGEVQMPDGTRVQLGGANKVHTGQYSVLTSQNDKAFQYKSSGLDPGRTYRLSVWTTSVNGQLEYDLDGTVTTVSADASKKAGDWYQINADITGGTNVTAYAKGVINEDIYWDDFRFHPITAPLTSSVYHPQTWELNYTLDKNNLFTELAYDDVGRPVTVQRESFGYGDPGTGKLLVSTTEYYDDARSDLESYPLEPVLTFTGNSSNRTWEVDAGGIAPYEYNWYKDGVLQKTENLQTDLSTFNDSECAVYDIKVDVIDKARRATVEATNVVNNFTMSSETPVELANGSWQYEMTVSNPNGVVSYSWKRDGVTIPGATNSILTISDYCRYTIKGTAVDECGTSWTTGDLTPSSIPVFNLTSLNVNTSNDNNNTVSASWNRDGGTATFTARDPDNVQHIKNVAIVSGSASTSFGFCIRLLDVDAVSQCGENQTDPSTQFHYQYFDADLNINTAPTTATAPAEIINIVEGTKPQSAYTYWWEKDGFPTPGTGSSNSFSKDLCSSFPVTAFINDGCWTWSETQNVPERVFSYSVVGSDQKSIQLGQNVSFSISVSNTCPDNFTTQWYAARVTGGSANCGNTSLNWTTVGAPGALTALYQPPTNGTYVMKVEMSEGSGETDCRAFGITVGNPE